MIEPDESECWDEREANRKASANSVQHMVKRRYAASAVLADRKPNGDKIIVHTLVVVMADDENGAMQAARDNATEACPRAIPFSIRACEVDPPDDPNSPTTGA